MKKILVPVDGSPSAKRACQVAKELALKFESNIILVTVVSDRGYIDHDCYMDKVLSDRIDCAKQMLLQIKEDFEDIIERVAIKTFVGNIAGEILACANREQVDLIVMGSRGLGAFSRTLLGSISNKIVHSSEISVLIVK